MDSWETRSLLSDAQGAASRAHELKDEVDRDIAALELKSQALGVLIEACSATQAALDGDES